MVHLCKWRVNSKILNPLDGPKRRSNAFLRYWAFLERTYNSHSFYAQFQKKNPPGGGGGFGGPEGCFCGFIAFWKLRCFPKSTKTLFLASLNLFERRYFCNIHCNITPFIFSFNNIIDSKRLSQISSMNDANFIHDRDLNKKDLDTVWAQIFQK